MFINNTVAQYLYFPSEQHCCSIPKHRCHGFFLVMVLTLSHWFTANVHHTSSPLGHCKKLNQRKRGIKTECVTICPKEIGNPIKCQGPHDPIVICQPLERNYNEWRTTPTLWPFEDWKHLPIYIGALGFFLNNGLLSKVPWLRMLFGSGAQQTILRCG